MYVKFDCLKCSAVLGPYYQDGQAEIKVGICPNCQSKGPFAVNAEQTVYPKIFITSSSSLSFLSFPYLNSFLQLCSKTLI